MPVESGEQALIARIRQRLPPDPAWVRIGIGDDAAVIEPERNALEILTTDTLVEGVHWDPRFCSPADVGHKSLAVNLSDVAAMGGTPRAALLSLSLPESWQGTALDEFADAFSAAARAARVVLVGGNVTSSPGPLVVSVTVSATARPRRVLSRSGGRAGDELYVTGEVGAALAGLLWLQAHPTLEEPPDPGTAACVRRYRRPDARTRIGLLAGRNRVASACMDLSDGLADAVRQVAGTSGTGARIDAASLPVPADARSVFHEAGRDAVLAACEGGDDYELLLAVPQKKRRALDTLRRLARGVAVTRIGELTRETAVVLSRDDRDEELPQGFSHFSP